MTLFVSNDREILYAEVDTIPPENAETQNYLYKILTERKYETVLYMATRNELEGNLKLLDLKTVADRKKFEKEYVQERKDDFAWQYLKFSEDPNVDYPDITLINGFTKAIVGQGLIYPLALNPNSLSLQTLSLEDIAKIDSGFARESGNSIQIIAFEAGHTYMVENGKMKKGSRIPYLKEYVHEKAIKNLDASFIRSASKGPLSSETRNTEAQESLTLNLLNTRFLPYWLGNLESPLKSALLASQGHVYVVSIRYGNIEDMTEVHYSYSFAKMAFSKMEILSKNINEDYWANDLEDFYTGTQELYSNFWHALDLRKSYRLWTVLGASFLNNDIVYRKIAHHFERANT